VVDRLDALRTASRGQGPDRTGSVVRRGPTSRRGMAGLSARRGSGDEGNRTPNPRLAKSTEGWFGTVGCD
jgi:hypothetical protein